MDNGKCLSSILHGKCVVIFYFRYLIQVVLEFLLRPSFIDLESTWGFVNKFAQYSRGIVNRVPRDLTINGINVNKTPTDTCLASQSHFSRVVNFMG